MRYLFSIVLLASSFITYGQASSDGYAISPRDATWLTKRGFPMDTYDWSNEAVNQQLALAARYRRQSSRCWRYGGLSYLAGNMTTFGIFIGTFGIPSSQRRPYNNAIYVATVIGTGGLVTALGGGIWRKAKARHRVRNALRLSKQ